MISYCYKNKFIIHGDLVIRAQTPSVDILVHTMNKIVWKAVDNMEQSKNYF